MDKNGDKLFLIELGDLYKLWQFTLAAEEDLEQDRKILKFLEGFSSDESYAKKSVRENHGSLLDTKSELQKEVDSNKSILPKVTEHVQKAKDTFEGQKVGKRRVIFAIVITVALFVLGCRFVPDLVNMLSIVDDGEGHGIIDTSKRDFFGGVLL